MRIAIGSDHAGYALKRALREWLDKHGIAYQDVGAHRVEPGDDYPDYARAVGQAVVTGEAELGLMVCGTGVGSSIALNKLPGVRAVACSDTFSARLSREHNDANVLCLGERVVGSGLAIELVNAFLSARFSEEERHRRRLAKVAELERGGRGDA